MKYYINGFQNHYDTVNQMKHPDEAPSSEPDAPGFKESDIRKYKGNGYKTF